MITIPIRLCASLALLCSSACYNPDLSRVRYTCPPEAPTCPESQVCVRGVCVFPGEQPDADQSGAPDQGQGPTGCRDGRGLVLDSSTSACPGAFAEKHAADLCADSFAPCQQISASAAQACAQLPAFYASALEAWQTSRKPSSAKCGDVGGFLVLMGCGKPAPDNPLLPVVLADASSCSPFSAGIDCEEPRDDGWFCGKGIVTADFGLAKSSNVFPDNGVLCCAK